MEKILRKFFTGTMTATFAFSCLLLTPPAHAGDPDRTSGPTAVQNSAPSQTALREFLNESQGMPLYYYANDPALSEAEGLENHPSNGSGFLVSPKGTIMIPERIQGVRNEHEGDRGGHEGGGHEGGGHGGGWDGGGHGGDWDHDCYYYGTCGYGSSCGYYTCYNNGYCCDTCGSCYSY